MIADDYEFPENPIFEPLLAPALRATETLARVDERLRRSSYCTTLAERFCFDEALAWQHAEGDLVHREDLVRMDAHVLTGMSHGALSAAFHTLRAWRRAAQADPVVALRSQSPGIVLDPDAGFVEAGEMTSEARRLKWQRVLRQTEKLPAILAAAIACDAWCQLMPEDKGAWKAGLLAALLLKARGLTSNYLLPLDVGRRVKRISRPHHDTLQGRLQVFLLWAHEAGEACLKEINRISAAEAMLRLKVSKARRQSHLRQLVDLFIALPVVTLPAAQRKLGISKQAISRLLPKLGSHIEEITDRQRYRAWRLR